MATGVNIRHFRPTNPTQLPDLRENLERQWSTASWFGASKLAHDKQLIYATPEFTSSWTAEQHAINACATEARLLREATLWWVGPEMCDLLYSTLDSVPEDTMQRHLTLPSAHGLVMLDTPWVGALDAEIEGHRIIVDAFCWGKATLSANAMPENPAIGEGTKCLSMSSYHYISLDANLDDYGARLAYAWSPEESKLREKLEDRMLGKTNAFLRSGTEDVSRGMWVPLGRSDWPRHMELGTPILTQSDAFEAENSPLRNAFTESTIQDRRLMAAFFALLESPGITHIETHTPSRQVIKQAVRKNRKPPPPVKVIYLRRPKKIGGGHEGDGRKLTKRHVVRAHPTHQPYGPNSSLRKLIMRGPYLKGPVDAPLAVPRPEVRAWIR
jgi:hypothetical protein